MPRKKGNKRSHTKGRKVSRRKNNMPSFVHRYCRFATNDPYIWMSGSLGSNYYFGADTFRLNEVQNYSQFLAVYEYYKIKSVEIKFKWTPSTATATVNTGTNSFAPVLWVRNDFNDDTVPTSIGELKSAPNTKKITLYPNREYVHKIKNPPILVRGYESATSDAFIPKRNVKIDMVDAGTPHFGLKICAEAPDSSTNYGNLEYSIKYTIDCYNPK